MLRAEKRNRLTPVAQERCEDTRVHWNGKDESGSVRHVCRSETVTDKLLASETAHLAV